MKKFPLILTLCIALPIFHADARRTHKGDGESSGGTITPGQFHALTIPEQTYRITVSTELYGNDYMYYTEDDDGNRRDFTNGDFKEWTTSLSLRYGLTEAIEIGLRIPFVAAEFEADPADDTGEIPSQVDESALGNINLNTSYGKSWNEESDNLLLSAQVGLPTDGKDHFLLTNEGSARVSGTFEHYWDRLGVIAGAAGNYYAEDGLSGGDWMGEVSGGIGFEPAEAIFVSGLVVVTEDTTRIEGSGEVIVHESASLEFFGGVDVDGDEDAYYFGVGVNFVYGE